VRTRLAIILLACASAVHAQQLGTLFHSAKEREALDRQRRGERVEVDGKAVVEEREPVITGYVKRSDGKSTVFLDKRPYRTTSESIQRSLEPRIVERYQEPSPPPTAPVPPARERGNGQE
jgi:hypothetical protein